MRISDWSSDVCSSDLGKTPRPDTLASGIDANWPRPTAAGLVHESPPGCRISSLLRKRSNRRAPARLPAKTRKADHHSTQAKPCARPYGCLQTPMHTGNKCSMERRCLVVSITEGVCEETKKREQM